MTNIHAMYYDGLSARQQPVTLSMSDGLVFIQGNELAREIEFNKIRISAQMGNTPRLLHFVDGSHCEVNDHAGLRALLEESGNNPLTILARLENSWRYAILATLMTISFVIAMYYWGLPYMANNVSEHIPEEVVLSIDSHVLSVLDDGLANASKLSTKRQEALASRFESLRNTNEHVTAHLIFRSSHEIGANAFALPGGTIIVTDQLVKLAHNDEEILAVLAHELGHVSERHPLRQMLQSTVVGLAMTWYVGDISTLLALAPTVLLESSYSRNFEHRADLYAANLLRQNKIKPSRLADILEKLEQDHAGPSVKREPASPLFELFSSHPDTDERIRILRSEDAVK